MKETFVTRRKLFRNWNIQKIKIDAWKRLD